MDGFTQWEILSAWIANSDGTPPPYPHRCIYLGDSPLDQDRFIVMGITSDLTRRVKDFSIDLPWDAAGHAETGLIKRCFAQALWTEHILPAEVRGHLGNVPKPERLQIAQALRLRQQRFPKGAPNQKRI